MNPDIQQNSDLWIDYEDVNESVPAAPVETRSQVLPLNQLSWENFERLCYRLALREASVADCRRYGIQGQEQQGIDIYVRRTSDGGYSTWQCKRYSDFSASDLEKAVSKFLENDWAKRSDVFHLAVTVSLSPTDLAKAVEKQAQICRTKGIEFVPQDIDCLSVRLKKHPDLVDDFFGRAWVEAFCGRDVAMTLSGRRLNKQQRIEARRRFRELYITHFATVDVGLPAAAGALREVAPQLQLQKRYVVPLVDSITSIIEPLSTGDKPPQNSENESKKTSTEDSKLSKTQSERGGFRTIEQRTKLNLFDWLESVERGVILGGPGLGKSAALRFLALDLLSDRPRTEGLARRFGSYLPIFVPFALLTRLVANQEVISINDFLNSWLHKLSAPPQTVELLKEALEDERLLLLVDGLDEWSDPTAASTSLTKILDFAIPRRLPVIASARPVGYERMGGLNSDWRKAELLPFGNEQQRHFTMAWFEHFHSVALGGDNSNKAITSATVRDTDSFMAEIEQDHALSELAGVPLLLSALIYLRLQGRVLPRNRFDALEAITKTLIFEQPQRRAQASLQGSANQQNPRLTERGIQFLAFFIHQSPGSESIPQDKAREALADFYQGTGFQKPASEAIEVASQLIDRATQEVGILVQRQPEQIGFLHRSLQEFLAAKELARWPFEKLKQFILAESSEPSWQETLLAVLHLANRQDEVDSFLTDVFQAKSHPLEYPLRKIFLARAVFSDLTCSVGIAERIADDIFSEVECSTWMPFRKSLLIEIVQGLDSEILGRRVRDKLKKWFPGKGRWRGSLFKRLADAPSCNTGKQFFVALFNSEHESELKDIAESIAAGANAWPELADRLISVLGTPADGELLAAVLHALALGWPQHSQLPALLIEASDSRSESLRGVAIIHRVQRGDKSSEIKESLIKFFHRDSRLRYPWEDDLINALKNGWPKDKEIRLTALRSAKKQMMPTEWDDRVALKYLIRAFPGDDDVAEILATILRSEDYLWRLGNDNGWDFILAGFKAHPKIIAAAEEWLQKYGLDRYDEHNIAHVAMLARTEKCKMILIDRLKGGKVAPQWIIHALLDIGGVGDSSIRECISTFMSDEKRVGGVANYLPKFIDDPIVCQKRLLALLEHAKGFDIGKILLGLDELGCLNNPDVTPLIERRLRDDNDGSFWYWSKWHLLEKFPHNRMVRQAALRELDDKEPMLSAIAKVYANDPDFRPRLDALIETLHEELRLELVHSLSRFIHRHDSFITDLLAEYVSEQSGSVRTAAAQAFYSSVRNNQNELEQYISQLKTEIITTGPEYDERGQAAFVGLLALGKPEVLMDPSLMRNGELRKYRSYADSAQNWEFIRAVIEGWDSLQKACGDRIWDMLESWDVFVCQLAQAGKRNQALSIPKNLIDQFRRQANMDVDVFLALSILEERQQSFQDFCLSLFNKMRIDGNITSVSWGHNEVQVWFEAARYLAIHYPGNIELGAKLDEIAQHSREPSGPLIALCRGWKGAETIETIWNSYSGEPFNSMPATAWLVNAKADTRQFSDYVQSLPSALQSERLSGFPRETIRAVRQRLTRDPAAQQLILESTGSSVDADNVASVSRLLGTVVRNREALRKWARTQIDVSRAHGKLRPMGFDILSGAVRPVELCILDACLTS